MKFYTDGGYSIPREIGGWGLVAVGERDKVIFTLSETEKNTTSNRMEMTAFLNALRYIKNNNVKDADIITDRNYVVQGYNSWLNGWKQKNWKKADGKPILNKDLWEEIDSLKNPEIKVRWVKGHNLKAGTSDAKFNDMVDKLTRDYR